MIVVPAIDLYGGKAVRLEQGRYDRITVYDEHPESRARSFAAAGAVRVHVVDLEAARDGVARQSGAVSRIVEAAGVPVQVGGGIRTLEAARAWIDAGARWVVLGTAAVREPAVLREACRALPDRVIVAIDARAGKVAIEGWTETSDRDAEDLAREVSGLGAAAILYTDIERDGTRLGPNVTATSRVAAAVDTPVLASGGVGRLEDLTALAAVRPALAGVIVGRALYAGAFTLPEAIAAASA